MGMCVFSDEQITSIWEIISIRTYATDFAQKEGQSAHVILQLPVKPLPRAWISTPGLKTWGGMSGKEPDVPRALLQRLLLSGPGCHSPDPAVSLSITDMGQPDPECLPKGCDTGRTASRLKHSTKNVEFESCLDFRSSQQFTGSKGINTWFATTRVQWEKSMRRNCQQNKQCSLLVKSTCKNRSYWKREGYRAKCNVWSRTGHWCGQIRCHRHTSGTEGNLSVDCKGICSRF